MVAPQTGARSAEPKFGAGPPKVDRCHKRYASRSTPWEATTARRSSSPAPPFRSTAIPIPNSSWSAIARVIEPLLAEHPALRAASRIVHTDVAVKMDDKPSQALRHGRWKSSMWMAIDAVKRGEADVAVSAGNTGALMAMAKFHLKTMAGIDRPAIAALWPTLRGEFDRARCRGHHRRRCPASRRSGGHGRRHGAGAVRPRAADGRPPQYRGRGGQGPGGGARGRPHPARGGPRAISTMSASWKATISAREPSTSSSPRASPAISP